MPFNNSSIATYDASPYPIQNIFYQICGYLSIPVNIVTIYLYQQRSETEIRVYKQYLTILQIFSGTYGVFTCLLMMPTTIPLFGGYCSGPVSKYLHISCHIQNIVLAVLLHSTLTAVLCCVLYRHQSVQMPTSKFRLSKKGYWFTVVLLYLRVVLMDTVYYFAEMDKEVEIEWLNEFRPDLLVVYEYDAAAYNTVIDPMVQYFLASFSLFLIFDFVVTIVLTIHSFYSINSLIRAGASSQRKNKQWMITLFLQSLVPLFLIFAPTVVLTMSTSNDAAIGPKAKAISNFTICLSCCYSLVNSIVVIARTPSYRRALLGIKESSTVVFMRGSSNQATILRS